MNFLLKFQSICQAQQNSPVTIALLQIGSYENREFMGTELICCMIDGQPKIVLPSEMEDGSIDWYHFVCGHAGSTRLNKTLK